ncbi:hypothetical protein O9G_004519 [Rozella allomycis CSF55]|uniref:Uncharacterized protein n=1 Tax=Rozella allomycis (strain CSF55) TaxID=988480 RepID=A0A075AT55_ROZAC|nr:hypothetical protein O9G_004519 [Rozella allomycis CSF55]|eukprot:EPZ33443.1 hypothetical protein O9G_004519 [Rozella allomycis CSF55]
MFFRFFVLFAAFLLPSSCRKIDEFPNVFYGIQRNNDASDSQDKLTVVGDSVTYKVAFPKEYELNDLNFFYNNELVSVDANSIHQENGHKTFTFTAIVKEEPITFTFKDNVSRSAKPGIPLHVYSLSQLVASDSSSAVDNELSFSIKADCKTRKSIDGYWYIDGQRLENPSNFCDGIEYTFAEKVARGYHKKIQFARGDLLMDVLELHDARIDVDEIRDAFGTLGTWFIVGAVAVVLVIVVLVVCCCRVCCGRKSGDKIKRYHNKV